MAKVTHYYPDALVVFVKGFRELENITREDLMILQTKEISSVNVTMTVANNPSTFSITINDVANRFSIPDNPAIEIANLRANSEFQLKRDVSQRSFKPNKKGGQIYYEFDGFKESKFPWFDFEWGTLVATDNSNFRAIVFYRRNPAGAIIERWAFDETGRVIRVSQGISEVEFQSTTSNGKSYTLLVEDNAGHREQRNFMLLKAKNSDFMTKYQTDVAEPLKVGRCKIEPMDRIAIFISKRFVQTNTGTWQIVQTPKTELVRAFTGLVNTAQMSYAEQGGNTVVVSGEDVTKWLKVSVVPVNPAAIQDQTNDSLRFSASDTYDLNFYTNLFQSITTPNLIKLLTLGTEGLEADARSKISGVSNVKIRGVGVYSTAKNRTTNAENIVYDPILDGFRVEQSGKQVKTVSTVDTRGMMGSLFTKSAVHVIDPTETGLDIYLAYNQNFQLPSNFQTDYQNRRDICYKAAQDSNFNFYADRNGHIWFHPPRYSNAWILLSANDKLQVLEDDAIISYGFVEDDSNVYSTCVVSSEPDLNKNVPDGADMFNRGSYTDELLTFKFGTKILTLSNPFISKLGGSSLSFASEPAIFYAKAMLQRLLANKLQGQITITGRAELDPGYPVYIPFRNMIYWVETVEHALSFGGQYTTTCHLSYGHKPWENIPEIITQSFDLIHSTDGHINIVRELSSNQPQVDNSGLRQFKTTNESVLVPDSLTSPIVNPNTQ